MRRWWMGALLGMAATAAEAEDRVVRESDRTVVRKETRVDFADQTVEGNILRPEGNYILDRNRSRFESLVRLRTSFERELRASTDGLQR
jgi:hypothetical protein